MQLQEAAGGAWRTVARQRLRRDRFAFRRSLERPGDQRWRVTLSATRDGAAASSRTLQVVVAPLSGIHKIRHVVIIMQENRSFDSYFGTYPGAEGMPPGVCVPDPLKGDCVAPFYDSNDLNHGGPHLARDSEADIANGAMNGFVAQAENGEAACVKEGACGPCVLHHQAQLDSCATEVMGYHDARDIPNYWTYAEQFVLQDHMFSSVGSWSLPAHLYLVSGWSALCANPFEPASCASEPRQPADPTPSDTNPVYGWTDVTWLLHAQNVSWASFVFDGREAECREDPALSCASAHVGATPTIWDPLRSFVDVREDGQLADVRSISDFLAEARSGTLPSVSWVSPSSRVSEHPPALISAGQEYVTGLIDAVMRSPDWRSTAIFLSWDDWGGFYDNVLPPRADAFGYGLRVPGLVISPYAKQGFIDHQILSHDAYDKFIEDDFLGGARLNPSTDGRPDPRPDVREESPILGNLASDFDFSQQPRPPLILPLRPPPGPASAEPQA